jgi:hypothetical protein
MRLPHFLLLAATVAAAVAQRPGASAAPPPPKPALDTEVLFSETFDDDKLLARGWYDGNRFSIVPRDPAEGKACLEYHWAQRSSVSEGTSTFRRLFRPVDNVYLRFRIKFSKGWKWTGRNYHPHLIQFMTTENAKFHGPAGSHLTLYTEPQEGRLRLAGQDIQNKDAPHGLTQGPLRGGYNGKFYDSQQVLFSDERWHTVESYFKLNTLDRNQDTPVANGIARGWVDGKLVIEKTDVIFRTTDFPKMKLNQLIVAPYFGPGLLPQEQTLWIDDMTLGTL